MSLPGYPFPAIVQMYCFPYRSVAAGKWDMSWPFWVTNTVALSDAAREASEQRLYPRS